MLLDQTTNGFLRQEQEQWLRHLHDTACDYAMSATDKFDAALNRIFPSSTRKKVAPHRQPLAPTAQRAVPTNLPYTFVSTYRMK
jgi:hypothetical protein